MPTLTGKKVSGFTSLYFSTLFGRSLDAVQVLLAAGASLHEKDLYEETAFLRSKWR